MENFDWNTYTTKKIAPMQYFKWSNIRLPSLAEFRKISPMKSPQPKWWKNWIQRTMRLRKIFVIIIWRSTENCCKPDSADSLLKNFVSCFIFWTKVPSLGRKFSIWSDGDGLRMKLEVFWVSLEITGTQQCLPFRNIWENCGITVSGSRSQSSMTLKEIIRWIICEVTIAVATYCSQQGCCTWDK